MASPVTPKAATTTTKVGESAKAKQPSGIGKTTPQARPSAPGGGIKATPPRSVPSQSASGKKTPGQSGTGKASSPGQSGASKAAALHSSPGSKLPLSQSSPRKSVFGKSVGQSGALKLGSAHPSPGKSFFGKSPSGKSPGSGFSQFDLPLALRKKRRPNAGMKREAPDFDDRIVPVTKSPKDGKTPPKRKLNQTSPNSSKLGAKHKADYVPPSSKKRKISRSNRDQDSRNDFYCWICHKEGSVICCELCPRVYHPRCAKVEGDPVGDWFCPECERATTAECVDSQSQAMSSLTLDQLAKLLMYALKRMKHSGAEPFLKPVSLQHNPGYDEFVFNPMDLSTLEKSIKKRMYGSTEAFLLDAKWILHNCIVFNGSHHKLTNSARMIIKICEYEMKEIEICPDCYLSASIKRDKWFCEVCRNPHKLVWARLQGFPFWPSKVIREKDGLLDVRFFGQHDRAWVPVSSCFMFSGEIPIPSKKKTSGLTTSIMEMETHILNLQKAFGKDCFKYAPKRTPYGTFESLTINLKDKEKWSENRAGNGLMINGVNDRSRPNSDTVVSGVKIKTEPIDSQMDDGRAETEKPLEAPLTEGDTVLEKGVPESCKSQEAQTRQSDDSEGPGRVEQSGANPSSKDAQATAETSQNTRSSNSVRRQVFTVTRKRTGGVIEPDKPATKISDTLSAASNKLDSGATESDDSELSSPSKAPVGVFEVSDESLDIDPELEAQSPAVQLLGKTHVSANNFGRSLAMKLEKLSPTSLAKKGQLCSEEGETGEEKELVQQEGELTEKDIPAIKSIKNQKKLCSDKSRVSDGSGVRDKQTTDRCTEQEASDEPGRTELQDIDEGDKQKSSKSAGKILDAADPSESGSLDEDIPSTSQAIPAKDKYHIKLGKTIETMKASLGIERLRSVEKETSDSESSAADSDSESSEGDHSEDSEMEVDDDQGGIVVKKATQNLTKDDTGMKTLKEDATETLKKDLDKDSRAGSPKMSTPNSQTCTDPTALNAKVTEKSSSLEDLEDSAGPITSGKSRMDSDIDLIMSCHSELSDSDEGELVIDESRTGKKSCSSPSKKAPELGSDMIQSTASPYGHQEHGTYAGKMDVQVDPAAMETDDVILVSDPFELQDNHPSGPKETKQAEEPPPVPSIQEKETDCIQEKETDCIQKETDCKNVENDVPVTINPSSDNSPSSKDDSQTTGDKETASSSSGVPKVIVPTADLPQNTEPPPSSSPKTLETLQADESPVRVPTPPTTSGGETVENADVTTAAKDVPGPSNSRSPSGETPVDGLQDCGASKQTMYKKYVEKMSSALEGVLDEFIVDIVAGKLLHDAKKTIAELKQQMQDMAWERKQEQVEFKQIMDLAVAEMKECMEAESKVALTNLRRQLEAEKQEEIRRTKTKQWCANCGKDAVFFCCWNTSYCDYPCQQSHWSQHRTSCQQRSLGNTVVQVQQIQNKSQQITVSSTVQTPSTSDIIRIVSPVGKSAADQLRLISNQQNKQSSSLATEPVPMQLHPNSQSNIQQHINQSATQPVHPGAQPPAHQPLHQTLQQQVQQVMQPRLQVQPPLPPASASTQPMQTLIQYVQAPRMSAPVPIRQLVPTHPYVASGRVIGGGGMRMVRP